MLPYPVSMTYFYMELLKYFTIKNYLVYGRWQWAVYKFVWWLPLYPDIIIINEDESQKENFAVMKSNKKVFNSVLDKNMFDIQPRRKFDSMCCY